MTHTGNAARLLAVSLALSLGLGGCFFGGNKPAEEEAEQPAQEQEATDARRAIGDVAEPSYEVSLVNACDQAIETLAMRPVGTTDYAGDLLAGAPISVNEEVVLRVAQDGAAQAYDLKATAAGGTITYEFVGVPVPSVTQVFLHFADGQPYVDYVAPDGTVSSTKDYLVAQEKKAAAGTQESPSTTDTDQGSNEDVSSNAAPVAASAYEDSYADTTPATNYSTPDYSTPDYSASDYDATSYEYDSYGYTYQDVPMEAPAATEQTTDACIDDVMLK